MVIHQTAYILYNTWHIELRIMFQELKSVKQANILKGDDDKEGLNPGYLQVQLEQHMNSLTYKNP